ncbi:MAG: hypothetical protein ACTSVY_08410 [Candidatus Helarchaeota archaeon]
MDYIVELQYPKNLEPRQKANFSTRFGRLGNFKIRRGQYLVDRKEILEKARKLASEFNVKLNITEYKELPRSLKNLLEQAAIESKVQDDLIKKMNVLKQGFKLFYDVFSNIMENPSIETLISEFEKVNENKELIMKAKELASK